MNSPNMTSNYQALMDERLDAVSGGFLLEVVSVKSTASKPLSGTDMGSGRVK